MSTWADIIGDVGYADGTETFPIDLCKQIVRECRNVPVDDAAVLVFSCLNAAYWGAQRNLAINLSALTDDTLKTSDDIIDKLVLFAQEGE